MATNPCRMHQPHFEIESENAGIRESFDQLEERSVKSSISNIAGTAGLAASLLLSAGLSGAGNLSFNDNKAVKITYTDPGCAVLSPSTAGSSFTAACNPADGVTLNYSDPACASFTATTVNGVVTMTCNSSAPATAVPTCTLTASPSTITPGATVYLFASCTPAATSYAWTNSGFETSVVGGSVSPTSTTTYSVKGTNAAGSGNTASATVTVSPTPIVSIQALFVNASTSANKTSVIRAINTSNSAGTLTATAFDESGKLLGTANASLGSIAANETRTFSSANLEQLIGFTPAGPTSKYSIYFSAGLSSFQIINYTRDNATGALALSQSLNTDRSSNAIATSVTRSAWFMSSSTSTNKTNVLRLINTSAKSGSLTATIYDEDGNLQGSANRPLTTINARQMVSYTSAELESAMNFRPASPTAKYRAIFSANVPSMELINFTKDIASGNIALVQAQIDERVSSASSSTRNALQVYPSTNTDRTTVLRLVNPNAAVATVTATVLNENGGTVASGTLGVIGANKILALTSAQIESALGYVPFSPDAKYRMVMTADVPTFEVLDNTRINASGNLYLAQAQLDDRSSSVNPPVSRNAYLIAPSNSTANTTELRLINTVSQNATLTATAYNDAGQVIGTNVQLGILGANQMLTLTSAQLQALFQYTSPSSTSNWRIVFTADVSNFEVINYLKDATTGLLVLAQPQTE